MAVATNMGNGIGKRPFGQAGPPTGGIVDEDGRNDVELEGRNCKTNCSLRHGQVNHWLSKLQNELDDTSHLGIVEICLLNLWSLPYPTTV